MDEIIRSPGIDPQRFREVLAHLPTGVTVITAEIDGRAVGMAANSVTSVSLDPPLMLCCPAKSSSTWPVIRACGQFCINIMARHHEEITRRFALKGADRFSGVQFRRRPAGPGLVDAVGWIECGIEEEHDAGDHTIVVAHVTDIAAAADTEPLIFFRGRYGWFQAT